MQILPTPIHPTICSWPGSSSDWILLAPGVSISAADDVTVSLGGFVSLGARPDEVPLGLDPSTLSITLPSTRSLARSVRSELVLYPTTVYLSTRAWF